MRTRPIRSVILPLTADERRAWSEAAASEGLTLRDWLRQVAWLAVARGGVR